MSSCEQLPPEEASIVEDIARDPLNWKFQKEFQNSLRTTYTIQRKRDGAYVTLVTDGNPKRTFLLFGDKEVGSDNFVYLLHLIAGKLTDNTRETEDFINKLKYEKYFLGLAEIEKEDTQ